MRAARASMALAAFFTVGCQGAGTYWANRGRDAGDVFDFKGGWALGVGAKAELTTYFGVGAGAGLQFQHYEKFGRKILGNSGLFLHLAAAGVDGMSGHGNRDEVHLLGVSISQLNRPATFDLARIGAEVLLPGVTGGIYLNLGQLADLLAGLFGFDPAGDDTPEPANSPAPDRPATTRARTWDPGQQRQRL